MKMLFANCLFFLSFCLFTTIAVAQKLSPAIEKDLAQREDSLKELSRKMVFGENASDRFRADSNFTRMLVRALQKPNSFYYNFDSVNIAKLYAPDSSFRIFTWQMKRDEYIVLQKGAIQMNTPDGSLKLFRLQDNSMFESKPLDSVRTNLKWIGAIYYKMIMKEYNNKKYYTLIGFDDFSISSNKKWIDVLHFDETGQPVFGGPFFSYKNDTGKNKRPIQARFSIEFKKEARAYVNYDPELDLIIVDHLASETDEPEKKFTYVPDGDYEGFKWEKGQWVHIDKIFNQALKDGEFPQEALLYDDAGKANEKKLEESSRKTMEKKTPVKKKSGGNN